MISSLEFVAVSHRHTDLTSRRALSVLCNTYEGMNKTMNQKQYTSSRSERKLHFQSCQIANFLVDENYFSSPAEGNSVYLRLPTTMVLFRPAAQTLSLPPTLFFRYLIYSLSISVHQFAPFQPPQTKNPANSPCQRHRSTTFRL
jgi:hypothetical protein